VLEYLKKIAVLSPKEKHPFIPKYYLIFVFYNKYRENKFKQREKYIDFYLGKISQCE
jgi:hypothetical protein